MAASGPSRLRATDEDKRARILEAALQVCERSGVEGTRMEEVASLAGVSKGTLYRFFESKEELLLATLLGSYEQVLPGVEGRAEAAPSARLRALLANLTVVLAAVAPRMNVHYQAWVLVAGKPDLKRRLYEFLETFHLERRRALEETIREGVRAGEFRADADPAAFADGIEALLSGFLYRSTFDAAGATPAALKRSFDALVVAALTAPGAPAEGSNDG